MTATSMRTHMCGEIRSEQVGEHVRLCGWVARRREHGEHLAFVDLRDHSGIVQCVVDGSVDVRSEWVLAVEGTVRARPEGTVNAELTTGEIEVVECTVDGSGPGRAAALPGRRPGRHRRVRAAAVPLRRPPAAADADATCACGPGAIGAMRAAMVRQGFCEVETPLLVDPDARGGAGVRRALADAPRWLSTSCPRARRSPSSC